MKIDYYIQEKICHGNLPLNKAQLYICKLFSFLFCDCFSKCRMISVKPKNMFQRYYFLQTYCLEFQISNQIPFITLPILHETFKGLIENLCYNSCPFASQFFEKKSYHIKQGNLFLVKFFKYFCYHYLFKLPNYYDSWYKEVFIFLQIYHLKLTKS